jgi:hypothetical protein
MIRYFGLDGEPLTMKEWGVLMERKQSVRFASEDGETSPDEDPTRIGSDHVGDLWVSTVWLGLNHNYGDGPPLIFETMVFPTGSYSEEYCQRYSTKEQAKEGHDRVVADLREGKELSYE